ncbi:DNA-binding helix-turn-helix protein [Peptostreptococcaceae bacterium oral taxon 113 str. W5053]|nr:DNA-binding helix-turn-helix protein [Peptostreptococcaceae bacterium oral taxon 113 str. W5053]
MNQRVKELRQALGLSGEKFAEPLGVQRNAISRIETGKNGLSEQMIKLICTTYNVNENWLRTGEGDMFNQTKNEFLSDVQKQFSLTEFQVNLVKTYLELSDTDKASIDKFITSCCQNPDNEKI